MNVSFFETPCKEQPRTDKCFGICDDQTGEKAYTSIKGETTWIANVINQNEHAITFTAIDNCISIYKDGSNDKESTCDGMLTFTQSLYLVELKDHGKGGWLPKAKEQLENTIKLLQENDNFSQIKYKKAYACNKRHPYFTVFNAAEKKAFFERTGFRIDAQTTIKIKR